MANELRVFENKEFGKVRTVVIDGVPWFFGKDVAISLGYSNVRDAIKRHVDEDDKTVLLKSRFTTLEIPNRGLIAINESGVYALIFGSKLDSARRFKHWVTSEVLPEIRKTGTYVANPENKVELMLTDLYNNQAGISEQVGKLFAAFEEQREDVKMLMDGMTVSTKQQAKLNAAAKDRVNHLLGGAHSERYKKFSRCYFINLWNNFKHEFGCASYKDLNPKYYDDAFRYISSWRYVEG